MDIVLLIVRLVLAGIFSLAGIGKLLDPVGSEKALRDFGIPEILAKPVSVLLPLVELTLAVLLIFVETSWVGAIGAGSLLLVFIGGMVIQLARGKAPDCHCFGQIHSEPVSPKSLLRNALFFVLATVLIFSGSGAQGLNILEKGSSSANNNIMQLIIGLTIIGLLGAIVYFLKNILDQQVKIMRRMDVLELLANAGREHEREDLANPYDGLPIGAPAPDFKLPSVSGKVVEFDHLLLDGKPVLLFFVSPNCSPCAALIPEIAVWKTDLNKKFNFVFISSGNVKENNAKFGETVKEILIQKDREVAEEFGATWTPTVLLINSDGTIGSHTAVGDTAIRELFEKLENADSDQDTFHITNGANKFQKSKFGASLPEFSLEDLSGRKIRSEDFQGRKTLVTFWSLTCPHCTGMLEDLKVWDKQRGLDEPNLIVFSDGRADEHQDLGLDSPVVLDKDYKIAEELGMSGTPSAVLVNEHGRIVSETAIGSAQIWALIGKKKGVEKVKK